MNIRFEIIIKKKHLGTDCVEKPPYRPDTGFHNTKMRRVNYVCVCVVRGTRWIHLLVGLPYKLPRPNTTAPYTPTHPQGTENRA